MTNYKGLTNYETWLANLYLVDAYKYDIENDEDIKADVLKNILEEMLFQDIDINNKILNDVANSFVSSVNFQELAKNYNEDLEYFKKMKTKILNILKR